MGNNFGEYAKDHRLRFDIKFIACEEQNRRPKFMSSGTIFGAVMPDLDEFLRRVRGVI